MFEWLKEHKYVVLVGCVLAILFVYYGFTSLKSPTSLEENNWNTNEETVEEEMMQEAQPESLEEILVDVKGAVNKPGVYQAVSGDRVVDLIEKAGGLKSTANDTAINFAMRVTDEMVLYVPAIGEELESLEGPTMTSSTDPNSNKVNINTATQTELETLPGIGPSKAQTIIEYRDQNGLFKTIEDIMSISGFGEKTFEKLKDSISVK